MPTLGLALGRVSCFCLFSLAPRPSPGEGHAQASWLVLVRGRWSWAKSPQSILKHAYDPKLASEPSQDPQNYSQWTPDR